MTGEGLYVSPVRSRHLEAAFRSPIRPLPGDRHGVFVPDLLLQRLAGPSSGPFGPPLLADAGSLRRRRSQRRVPVAQIPVLRSQSRFISAPLRGVAPSGSLRSPICYREARLPKLLDLPWLPALGTPTAARRFGFATGPEAGCSSNLLEPLRFSPRRGSEVNRILKS